MARKIKKYEPGEKRPKGVMPDGRRKAKIRIGIKADGSPLEKYVYGYTKTELEANKLAIIRKYRDGYTPDGEPMLFGVYAVQWFNAYIKPKNLSPSGENGYRNSLNNHILPVFGDRQIRSIQPIELQEFLNSKTDMSQSLVSSIYNTLRAIFRMAAAQYVIVRDPMLTVFEPVANAGKRRALTKKETDAILNVIDSHPEGLFLMVLYYMGLRKGEALGLQWSDIDLRNGVARIQRDIDYNVTKKNARLKKGEEFSYVGELKSAAAYRDVPIAPQLLTALRKRQGIGQAYVFQGKISGSHLSERSYQRMWNRLMVALYNEDPSVECTEVKTYGRTKKKPDTPGKPGPKPKPPQMRSILTAHYFRHNFGTLLYEAGVDIKVAAYIFGHKDIETLLKIYADLRDKHRIAGSNQFVEYLAKVFNN